MAIKLNRIRIQNFKPFEDFSVTFENPALVVFDGPNGFGKTSFYDAIELLLTGRLRRYSELVVQAADRRQYVIGNPVFNARSGSGDLIIRGELEVGGKIVCLVRIGKREDLLKAARMEDIALPLSLIPQFDSDAYTEIPDEDNYLIQVLGKDYIHNFHFLNYIEQEDNIYLLKKKNTDRKESIKHLFNTAGFEERIAKLSQASRTIGKLCGTEAKRELEAGKINLQKVQTKLSPDVSAVSYERLIPWKTLNWDSEKMEFRGDCYVEWLGEEGELAKLECFLTCLDEFRKEKENRKLNNLLANEDLVEHLVVFWNFIDKTESFSCHLALNKSITEWLNVCEKGIIDAIDQKMLFLAPPIRQIAQSSIDVRAFTSEIEHIREMEKNANTLSLLLVEIKAARQTLIDKFIKYEAETEPQSVCPLCGFAWEDVEKLKAGFDAQANQLEQLITASGAGLNTAIEAFSHNFIEPIKRHLTDYLLKHEIDEVFVTKLKKATLDRLKLEELFRRFLAKGIDLRPFLNDKPSIPERIDLEPLRALVKNKKNNVDPARLRPWFDELFLKIFDENIDNAAAMDKGKVSIKRNYIEWQYSLYQNSLARKLSEDYTRLEKQFKDAESLKDNIDRTKKIYDDSLKDFRKYLIENIGILFHIYSGRIMQDGQNGLGLFIKSDCDGICFIENHTKEHDAVFTMSSGQLAALVIAFTLALNQRYSKSRLLFIDDPVQTLDELNIAGFIELLRHEFADRQIFISTHEDMMSAYMRYKFEKFNLPTQRLSFKDAMLAATDQ